MVGEASRDFERLLFETLHLLVRVDARQYYSHEPAISQVCKRSAVLGASYMRALS